MTKLPDCKGKDELHCGCRIILFQGWYMLPRCSDVYPWALVFEISIGWMHLGHDGL